MYHFLIQNKLIMKNVYYFVCYIHLSQRSLLCYRMDTTEKMHSSYNSNYCMYTVWLQLISMYRRYSYNSENSYSKCLEYKMHEKSFICTLLIRFYS